MCLQNLHFAECFQLIKPIFLRVYPIILFLFDYFYKASYFLLIFVLLKLNYKANFTSTFPLQVKHNLMEELSGRKWINKPEKYSIAGDCTVAQQR
jgi:hypothetical protein